MAEITQLESKIGEVLGLAQAAQQATRKVARLAKGDDDLVGLLNRMRDEAAETEKRTGKKTAINRKARETKAEAQGMLDAYLGGDDVDALDGLEFLIMAEAGELGHWEIVATMGRNAKDRSVVRLAEWATPIQQHHFDDVRSSSLRLAGEEDPNEPGG